MGRVLAYQTCMDGILVFETCMDGILAWETCMGCSGDNHKLGERG